MGKQGEKAKIPEGLPTYPLSDKQVRRITNLHLVTRPGQEFWRVEQCIGELSGGAPTLIDLPVKKIPRDKATAALIGVFKDAGRFAKVMNVFEPGVLTKVW